MDSLAKAIKVRYRNSIAALMVVLASLVYWILYWLSYIIICLSGCAIILGLILPRSAWSILYSMINRYHTKGQFKEEL